ncbi:MAG: 3-methyl-2-oxobutanoate hydroxymethyltransferase [Nitrospinae bacterium CG11_big_fil_rev_8_21_14_0_20_56_8]|nr:MAG: 3-methyl-2-oxobutanoate hydroxymethyltransferase [Nitrospinae bacterium CG11_big_fil_rev_8_21_14_0_20_56_8]
MNPNRITVPGILARKSSDKKITALTAYDYCFSRILDDTEIDIVLVGDSLGMVVLGYENTLPVTMEEMLAHTRAVKRGIQHALLVGDMPFMSYQVSIEQAVTNAGRFVQEGGAEAVKLEGGVRVADKAAAIVRAGIPVMGHIGLTPQSVHQFGGYRVQGKSFIDARHIKQDAKELQKAGVFSIVLEGIPLELAAEITQELKIPTIGIGAGPQCDGQILVLHDLLGLNQDFVPKFVKQYAQFAEQARSAVQKYVEEVRSGQFPSHEHTYHMQSGPLKKVEEQGGGK